MIERPIIFSGPMVRAILRDVDPKWQTRRVLRIQPKADVHYDRPTGGAMWGSMRGDHGIACPFGVPGDRLWVRESGWQRMRASGTFEPYYYDADFKDLAEAKDRFRVGFKRRPAIHMPRAACRLLLAVTGVRVERLQDITAGDVDAEGLDSFSAASVLTRSEKIITKPEHWIGGYDEGISFCRPCAEKKIRQLTAATPNEEFTLDGGWRTESDSQSFCDTCECYLDSGFTDYCCGSELDHFEASGFDVQKPSDCYSLDNIIGASLWKGGKHSDRVRRLCYRALWDALNAQRGYGWAKNPWVWVVEFKRAEVLKVAA